MRLLYVCGDPGIRLDGHKGASVHVRQTLGALADQGVDVTVLVARAGDARAGAAGRLVKRSASPDARGPALEREIDDLALSQELLRDLGQAGPFDVVYERYSLWSLAGLAAAKRFVAPLIVEVNAPLVDEQARWRGLELTGVAEAIERSVLEAAALVLCVSSPLAERAARLRRGMTGIEVLPNSVDTQKFQPRATDRSPGRDEPTVVFVGSLKPWHGVENLLEAFAGVIDRLPAARLVIVGDGPQRSILERQARAGAAAASVVFTGAVPHEEVPRLLQAADVAVAPYPLIEDFYFSPLKIFEYMACGLPVIASSSLGDLAARLEHQRTAWLVPPGDPAALRESLARLLVDRPLRDRLGLEARRFVETHHDLATSTRRVLARIESLRGQSSVEKPA